MCARLVLAAALCAAAAAYQAPRHKLAGVRAQRSRVAPPLQMAGSRVNVVKELIVPVPASHLYGMLTNYSRYKEIWKGDYQSVTVLNRGKGGERGRKDRSIVEFKHTPILGIGMDYTLDVATVPGKSVLWDLNSSSAIAFNHGGWNLTDLGDGSTKVTYGCVVQLKLRMPAVVTSAVLDKAFPRMLQTFSASAIRDWAEVQVQTRARFERPLQAAAGEVGPSIEAAADFIANATKAIVSARAQDFSALVDELLKSTLASAATLRMISDGPEAESPGVEIRVDQNRR
jgi:ribosome-associated toxin RatA of RatAB toxin-antitoxin module